MDRGCSRVGVALVCGLAVLGVTSGMGCAADVEPLLEGQPAALAPVPGELSFSELTDPLGIGSAGETKTRELIASGRRYQRLFGHAAPSELAFNDGDAVIFYSAGVQRTGGYRASVERVLLRGTTLHVTTSLESPGADCIVTQALSKPYTLVKVRLPSLVTRVRFHARNTVRDCTPDPDFCGGVAGFPCPAGLECIDDPNDECDPTMGGADCGGICVPATDACATVRCRAGTHCEVDASGTAQCVADPPLDPCATVRCARGSVCQPNEQGGAGCVPAGPFCGGIAAFMCPGIGECIDDPTDDCSPRTGGADCSGVCVCEQTQTCPRGSVFDSSTKVCACVRKLAPPSCATVLCPTGTRCEEHDGSPACVSDGSQPCGSNVCGAGRVCCNASCGICTAPGMFCTQQACL